MRDITGLSNKKLLDKLWENGECSTRLVGENEHEEHAEKGEGVRAELLRRLTLNKELVDALKTIAAWSHIPELPASSFEAVKLFAKEALAKVSQ